jgi:hypothetical protein
VPLYRKALEAGLTGERRRRAVIQLARSLRNLGQSQESVALLTTEMDAGSDHLDDAVRATLALAHTDVGREREAVSLAIAALASHLPRPVPALDGQLRPAGLGSGAHTLVDRPSSIMFTSRGSQHRTAATRVSRRSATAAGKPSWTP